MKKIILLLIKNKKLFLAFVFGTFIITCLSLVTLKDSSTEETNNNKNSLSIYFWGEIPKFNPIHPDGLYVWWLQNLVWDRLIDVDKQFLWSPRIAESWAFNSDLTELKLKIKKDLKWSDGRMVTQEDFEYSFCFYKDESLKAAIFKPILERVKTIVFKNNTLTLRLDPKLISDPFYATHTYWSHIMSTVKLYPHDQKKFPYLGTGAFTVSYFSNSGKIILAKNIKSWFYDNYSEIKMPKKIYVRKVTSEETLKKVIDQKRGVILGKDIYSFGPKNWYPVRPIEETVILNFNFSKYNKLERRSISILVQELNDLEKLNLNFKNLMTYQNFDFKSLVQTSKKSSDKEITAEENNKHLEVKNKFLKEESTIELIYFNSEDEKWLTYLAEKLKKYGLTLNLVKVSQSVFNEKIFKRKFDMFVDTKVDQDFYPHYMSFHSKGDFNVKGWSDSELDHHLEEMISVVDSAKSMELVNKIKDYVTEQYPDIPLFKYESSVLWTRNPCKPIQRQFQGLGLIYKAIICADNL